MDPRHLDVAIIGSGLAGTLLARQLRRALPSLAIGVFEKSTAGALKVGESTVEIASNYLIRRLGLSSYLYERQLPKNGLRFFFDAPDRSAPLERMSEIGTTALPYHPTFQINRARLESDLRAQNAADGILVRTGAQVSALELGAPGGHHAFTVTEGTTDQRWQCRWLIDAAGRSSLLARIQGLRVEEPDHPIAAVWGRFTGMVDLDDVGSEPFRARARFSSRMLSTTHFCYPGYWIWLIPLREGVVSVGVVGERTTIDATIRTKAGFRAFLDQHRAARDVLARTELIDHGSYGHMAYGTRRYFSADRWGLTGEAASFADPFYSPGSDYIALENDFLTDLVRRDVGGETREQVQERADLYDQFMHFRHEAAMRLYRGLYQTLGSYELLRLKWDFDIALYYNLWADPYMQDHHLDATFVRRQLRERPHVLQALTNFADLFRQVEASLKARGTFFDANLDRFSEPLAHIDFTRDVGTVRSREEVLERTSQSFNATRCRALDLLTDTTTSRAPRSLTSFMTARALA